MKTQLFALAFSLVVLLPGVSTASGNPCAPDTLAATPSGGGPAAEELEIDLDEAIWFQEKVYIHIYDHNEEPLIEGAFSRKELGANKELKSLLRRSTRFLSIDRHHYYYVKQE